jgi:hypothetical protein
VRFASAMRVENNIAVDDDVEMIWSELNDKSDLIWKNLTDQCEFISIRDIKRDLSEHVNAWIEDEWWLNL